MKRKSNIQTGCPNIVHLLISSKYNFKDVQVGWSVLQKWVLDYDLVFLRKTAKTETVFPDDHEPQQDSRVRFYESWESIESANFSRTYCCRAEEV